MTVKIEWLQKRCHSVLYRFVPKKVGIHKLKRGTKVVHSVFGEGTFYDGWLVILFSSAGQRLIDTKWALYNCRRVA